MFKFDADLKTVDTGVWMEYQGSEFLIAHISNMKFQRALTRLQQPYRKKLENGTMDPEENRKVLCRAMAEGILLGWKNVGSVNGGGEIQYTLDNATKALTSGIEFRDWVSDVAQNLSHFRANEIDELGKA